VAIRANVVVAVKAMTGFYVVFEVLATVGGIATDIASPSVSTSSVIRIRLNILLLQLSTTARTLELACFFFFF
jgi:hypothetical protein